MTLRLAAGGYTPRPLNLGDVGWDVLALQLCLNGWGAALLIDGAFGEFTDSAVHAFQRQVIAAKLPPAERDDAVDGIAGPQTKRELSYKLIWPAQAKHSTPPGLVRGMVEGESGFDPGNYTKPYANRRRDVGLVMNNIDPTDDQLVWAFNGPARVMAMAASLRKRFDYCIERNGTPTAERAWRYGAVLFHNWQSASERYVAGTIHTWRYEARFIPGGAADAGRFVRRLTDGTEVRSYSMADRAQWIVHIGVAGVDTGYEWAEHYIDSKAKYVRSWSG